MKNVLITGENSYIGTSIENWLLKSPEHFQVSTLSLRDEKWKEQDFSNYDVVFHVAGIAHVSSDPDMKAMYYEVNRDLTVKVAQKARNEGVIQFIFMSSIIVYGQDSKSEKIITRETEPTPSDFYGDSKLQAEVGLRYLESEEFHIAIVRPPMIYGKGSKGNYPRLAKLAKKTPIFPDYENERSMLHIDNLSELIRLIIVNESSGTFHPQNRETVQTSKLVKEIAAVHGHTIWMTQMINPFIKALSNVNIINKVFGTFAYDKSLSEYENGNYQIRSFKESIELTEH